MIKYMHVEKGFGDLFGTESVSDKCYCLLERKVRMMILKFVVEKGG